LRFSLELNKSINGVCPSQYRFSQGMTKVFRKVDKELDQATDDFLHRDAVQDSDADSFESAMRDVRCWLLGKITQASAVEIKKQFAAIYVSHFTKLRAEVPGPGARMKKYMERTKCKKDTFKPALAHFRPASLFSVCIFPHLF